MNELIRELAEQASTHAEKTVHYYMGQFDGLTWEAKILKVRDLKFAELIVLECAKLVDQDWHVSGAELREHFGMEWLDQISKDTVSVSAEVVKRLLKRFAEDCIKQVGHKDSIQFVALQYNIKLGE